MSLHLLDLRPVMEVPLAEKARWPVSMTLQPDGTPLVVSRWGDEVWDWYPYIPQENQAPNQKQLDWRFSLPDGRRLTDPEHTGLLESAKDFIWSLFVTPVDGRKRPSMMTLRGKATNLRTLIRWMVAHGLTRFDQLAGRVLDYVASARFGETGKPSAPHTITLRLHIIEDLYFQRDKLQDALRIHPWPHESAGLLAGEKHGVGYDKPKTDFIPDAVATRLAEAALDYIRSQSVRIFAARETARTAGEEKAVKGCGGASQANARTAAAREAGYEGTNHLSAEALRLRTACYIIINMFSGARNSEVMSLAERCIVPGTSKDGTTDVLWMHGTLYKTGVRPHRWMVPPVVKEAVTVLAQLTAPLRDKLTREELELTERIRMSIGKEQVRLVKRLNRVQKHKAKLFLATGGRGRDIAVLTNALVNQGLKQFCADVCVFGADGQRFDLHSHMFRRTYARFVARSELGDLLFLRDHFGHWSIDMTTYYADGGADEYEADTELLEMVAAEKMGRQTEIMTDYLDSDAPLANGSHWLRDWRSTVRTAANKEELIREYAGTITLNGTGHSWCVGNAKGTGCGGLCVFEAQMCVDCNYGIIGHEHRPVWEGIREQQQEAIALDDMGPGGRARAQQILGYAEKVLRRLAGQEVVA